MSERLNSDRLNNDFQFIEVGRKDPKKKLLRQRKREFVEIHDLFKPQQAADQAHAQCSGFVAQAVDRQIRPHAGGGRKVGAEFQRCVA